MTKVATYIILTVNLASIVFADIGCRGEDGQVVDWYYSYKLPLNHSEPNSTIAAGVAYMYLMSSQPELSDWILSHHGVDNSQSMMGRTLQPLYADQRSSDLAYVLYNDEDPAGHKSETKGHSKGVLVLDQNKGFWMMHSVPRYPPWPNASYSYPSSGLDYGQNFLCISINTDQADKIGTLFQYSIPNIYNYSMPLWTQEKLPSLFDAVVNSKKVHSEPWFNITNIRSAATTMFTSFAKHTKFGKDVYEDLLAPNLQSDLYVETWIHGGGTIPSMCSSYHIMNVESVNLNPANFTFTTTSDHSKWAVSPGNSVQRWICIGDNNHTKSQKTRAGITLCQQSNRIWSAYTRSISSVQPCPSL